MNGLVEILRNKQWAISPDYLNGALEAIRGNLKNHTPLAQVEKKPHYAMIIGADGKPIAYEVSREGMQYGRYQAETIQVPFVNVMTIDGAVTRGGGECTYGSKDMRDMLMKCADNPFCMGHIFEVNTPGGSAWARHDFKQGIDYAHERGQRVIMHIDGTCFSAGMWLASLCDEVYAMNPADEVGCIGVLASFFTLKNGAHNQFDAEDYHEIYDPESFDKNKWYRDIAENNNDSELVEDLRKTGEEFRSDIRKAFPAATEDQIHGKTFDASEVMGVFVDGINTLDDCIERLFDIADGKQEPGTRTNFINSENMDLIKEMKALISRKESEGKQGAEGAAANSTEQLNAQIAQLTKERDEARENEATLKQERDNAIKERDTNAEQVNNLTAERDKLQNSLNEANNAIAERDKEITNLKGQLGSNYQPGNRLNGQSAGEEKKNGKKTADEQLQECRDKMGWTDNKKK